MNRTILTLVFGCLNVLAVAQGVAGHHWVIRKHFLVLNNEALVTYDRVRIGNIFNLDSVSFLFNANGTYTGTNAHGQAISGFYVSSSDSINIDSTQSQFEMPDTNTFQIRLAVEVLDLEGVLHPAESVTVYVKPAALPVVLKSKIYLQGPYSAVANLMQDSLRRQHLIPIVEPYSGLNGFQHVQGGGEQTTQDVLDVAGADAIVDWVFLELRDHATPTQVVATRSALLQRDGDVVDVDGKSPVHFNVPGNQAFFPVVRHRNHLGVMLGASKYLPSGAPVVIDFTALPPEGFYAHNALNPAQKLVSGRYTLWAGNGRTDPQLKYNGSNNDRNAILLVVGLATPNAIVPGYLGADYNLDGVVKYNGAANDRNVLLGNVGIATPSAVVEEQVAR